MNKKLIILIILIFIFGCKNSTDNSNNQLDSLNLQKEIEIINPIITNRDSILTKLRDKIENKEPIVIHVFVALYGYDTVKIEGVQDWADGTNQNTNLYWGGGYGIKTYFKKYDNWKMIFDQNDISKTILERIVFTKTFSNGAEVYLIADAYIGYEMQTCLKDYFTAISEKKLDSI
jgi:uncharacterized protein YcfL